MCIKIILLVVRVYQVITIAHPIITIRQTPPSCFVSVHCSISCFPHKKSSLSSFPSFGWWCDWRQCTRFLLPYSKKPLTLILLCGCGCRCGTRVSLKKWECIRMEKRIIQYYTEYRYHCFKSYTRAFIECFKRSFCSWTKI